MRSSENPNVGNEPVEDDDASRPSSPRSIISLSDSLFASCFSFNERSHRTFSNRVEVYQLPADNEELERLDQLHVVFKLLRGSNYSGPVQQVLGRATTYKKAVLDLGCGTGLWVREMANEFPHCSFTGVDLVPVQAKPYPPQCWFEVDDINLGLEHYHGQFDLVQARMVALGIRDYKETLDQMWKTVRPMGLLLLQDPDFHLYDDYGIPMEVEDLTSSRHRWLATYINCFGVAERRLCRDIQAFTQFQSWLGQYPDLEDLGYDDCWMPIGLQYPSPESDQQRHINLLGELVRRNLVGLVSSSRTLLLESGLEEEFVDRLESQVRAELRKVATSADSPRSFIRIPCVWAQKGP